ncbi:DUF3102 domain-containing protein [Bradyrhizobium sp. 14AA]
MTAANLRALATIAHEIHKLERKKIFEIGDLLLEARARCEYGEWMAWLEQFGWSWDTADRYAGVAELASRFRNLRNLKVPATVLYDLLDLDEDKLPSVVAELCKHAATRHLTRRDAERVFQVGIGRRTFGDYPDATLAGLVRLAGRPWAEPATNALKERKPETDEEAEAIIDEAKREYVADLAEADREAEREAEGILDGDPPDLPPTIPPCGKQKFGTERPWPDAGSFADAVGVLLRLREQSVERFVGSWSAAELLEAANFLGAVAACTRSEAA